MQAPEDTAPLSVLTPPLIEAENCGFNIRDAVMVLAGPISVVVHVLPPEIKVSVVRPDGASVTGSLPIRVCEVIPADESVMVLVMVPVRVVVEVVVVVLVLEV